MPKATSFFLTICATAPLSLVIIHGIHLIIVVSSGDLFTLSEQEGPYSVQEPSDFSSWLEVG